jgi:replicative DNA helicase
MTQTVEYDLDTDHRLPPQDLAAEACVLGSMLMSPSAIGAVSDILTAGDFYRPDHAAVYRAISDLYARGEPADAVTVAAALNGQGLLARIGGAQYLHTLMAQVPNAASVGYYARLVQRCAEDRNLIDAGTRIIELGRSPIRDPDSPKHGQATSILHDAIRNRAGSTLVRVGDVIDDTLNAIEAGPQPGLSTGFPDLDDLTNGLCKGQFWMIGARPSVGKSTVLMDIARAVAIRQQQPVLYFSLEMTRHELIVRMLSAESGVAHKKLLRGGAAVSSEEWDRLAVATGRIGGAPFEIDETPGLTIVDIAARSRREAAAGPIGLIIVDHVHIMGATGGRANDSREREIARITGGLKILAKDLDVPVLAAGQLNRGPEQRTDKRPQLSDFRDSGSVEQDLDVAILLHRDDYYDPESPRAGEADFIVAKNRHGERDTVTVASQLHVSRFVSMAI